MGTSPITMLSPNSRRLIFLITDILLLTQLISPIPGKAQSFQASPIAQGFEADLPFEDVQDIVLAADGQYIAFTSLAGDPQTSNQNFAGDIFFFNPQNLEVSLISANPNGNPGNAGSFHPSISADGRFIAFASLASDLDPDAPAIDRYGLADIYLHDRQTAKTTRISLTASGEQATGWSDQPALSADGNYVAFSSTANDLSTADNNPGGDIYIFDQKSGRITLASSGLNLQGSLYDAFHPAISLDGRYTIFIIQLEGDSYLYTYDILTGKARVLPRKGNVQGYRCISPPSISATGNWIAFYAESPKESGIYIASRERDQSKLVLRTAKQPGGCPPVPQVSISADGEVLFTLLNEQIIILERSSGNILARYDVTTPELPVAGNIPFAASRTLVATLGEERGKPILSTFAPDGLPFSNEPSTVSGWVSDGLGHPMRNVKILSTQGHFTYSQADGSFYLPIDGKEKFEIRAKRDGYTLKPGSYSLDAAMGKSKYLGLAFTAVPNEIIAAAREDIGMPYALDRGCESPNRPCGGPYSGFFSGDCTDVVIDAYRQAAIFNLQFALQRDFQDHPYHYYRWRDARNAHDMWRYFRYTNELLDPGEAYQIGDIVFFDWEADGVIDHVALISEVTAMGSPRKMIDATGYTTDNPSGLAAELDWKDYHTEHTPGHARWTGQSSPAIAPLENQTNYLLLAINSTGIDARVTLENGEIISSARKKYPGASFSTHPLGALISISNPLSRSRRYTISIDGQAGSAYQLGIQIIENKQIYQATSISGTLPPDSSMKYLLELIELEEGASFTLLPITH